jgi:hypothetical protein
VVHWLGLLDIRFVRQKMWQRMGQRIGGGAVHFTSASRKYNCSGCGDGIIMQITLSE